MDTFHNSLFHVGRRAPSFKKIFDVFCAFKGYSYNLIYASLSPNGKIMNIVKYNQLPKMKGSLEVTLPKCPMLLFLLLWFLKVSRK